MNILVLNGSPRPNGNTSAMAEAFVEGASENGHNITVVAVCRKKIAGCLACEYCHTKGNGRCVQQDEMQEIYPVLEEAEMIVLASPVYEGGNREHFHGLFPIDLRGGSFGCSAISVRMPKAILYLAGILTGTLYGLGRL